MITLDDAGEVYNIGSDWESLVDWLCLLPVEADLPRTFNNQDNTMKRLVYTCVFLVSALALHSISFAQDEAAGPPSCESSAEQMIRAGYSEGGSSIVWLSGAHHFNESFFDDSGQPGINSRVAFLVGFQMAETQWAGAGTVVVIADCVHGEPSTVADRNGDGILDLSDLVTTQTVEGLIPVTE